MDEFKIIKAYESGKSVPEIAEEYSTYSVKIYRILKKHNVQIRTKGEAQSIALSNGRSKHPTQGKNLSDTTKENISENRSKAWANMPKKDKEKFRAQAKERWDALSKNEIHERQRKAGKL